jgi:hypothetical protein
MPLDTGQGNGRNNTAQPLLGYIILQKSCYLLLPNCSATDAPLGFVTGLNGTFENFTSGRIYWFSVAAVNLAGSGPSVNVSQITLFLPSPPLDFTATVTGNLAILLSWKTPSDTGLGNQIEPIIAYRVYRDGSIGGFVAATAELIFEGLTNNLPLTYPASRKQPYYYVVTASNLLGYGKGVEFQAFAQQAVVATPTIPQNLTARVVGVQLVQLTWSLPNDTGVGDQSWNLTGFDLQLALGELFSPLLLNITIPGSALSWTLTMPAIGPSFYFFRIASINEAGKSSQSDTAQEQGVGLPGIPSNLSAITIFDRVASLTWDLPLDTGVNGSGRAILRYYITASTSETQILQLIVASPALSTNITGLSHLIVYTFRVYAINDAGQSLAAAMVIAQPVTYPSEPVNLTAVVRQSLQIVLLWSIPLNTGQGGQLKALDWYLLEMENSTQNVSFANTNSVQAWQISCVDQRCSFAVNFSAARPEPYRFRLRAKNVVGLGASSYAFEQSINVPSPPVQPSALVTGPRQITILWTIPDDTGVGNQTISGLYQRQILNYTLEQSFGDSTFVSQTTLTILGAQIRSIAVNLNVASPTYFFFRIYAINSAGRSLPSSTVSEQSLDLPSISNISIDVSGPLRMLISWTNPVNFGPGDQSRPLVRYLLQAAENQTVNFTWLQLNIPANSTSQSVSGFTKGLKYTFRIAAVNSAGIGPFQSSSKDAISLSNAATNFTARISVPFQIDLAWNLPTDTGFYSSDGNRISSFALQYSTDNLTWSVDIVLGRSQFAYLAQNLTKGLTYIFHLWTLNDAGRSTVVAVSQEQSIDVPSSPLTLVAAIKAPLQFNLSWSQPNDTGRGIGVIPQRALNLYIVDIVYAEYPPVSQESNFQSINFSLSVAPNATFQILSKLAKGKTVFARIRATNDAGFGAYSNTALQYVVDTPSAPSFASILADQLMSVTLQWSPPADTGTGIGKPWPLTINRIQISLDSSFPNATSNLTVPGNLTAYVIRQSEFPFSVGLLYYFRLFSVNLVGESNSSQVGKEHALVAPTQPQNLGVVVSQAREMELIVSWTPPTDTGLRSQLCVVNCSGPFRRAIWYVIQRISLLIPPDAVTAISPQAQPAVNTSALFDQNAVVSFTVPYSVTYFNDSGLEKGLTYYYRIFAFNTAARGNETSSVYEMAISVPSVVLNVELQHVVYFTGYMAGLIVRWQSPQDFGNGPDPLYRRPFIRFHLDVYQATVQNLSLDFATDVFEFNATGLVKGAVYFFRLSAINAAGRSPYSLLVNKTAISRPTPPSNPKPTVTNPGEITFFWESPFDTGATGKTWPIQIFTVQVDTSPNFTSPNNTFSRSGDKSHVSSNFDGIRYFLVTDGLLSTNIFFRAYATNEAGTSDQCPTVSRVVIDLPSVPRNFSALRTGPLTITIFYARPSFTGSTKSLMQLSYILEMSLVNDSFVNSPFVDDNCFPGVYPACVRTTASPYDIGINGSAGISFNASCPLGLDLISKCTSWRQSFDEARGAGYVVLTGLSRGHTYYFRIFAANDAGLSIPTVTVTNISVGLSSPPRNVFLTLEGFLTFRILWTIPADTGVGHQTWPVDSYQIQIQSEDMYILGTFGRGTVTVSEGPTVFTTLLANERRNVSIRQSTTYYVRVFAVNEVGNGEYSSVIDNRPSITSISPTHGPAVGNTSVTLYGYRLGDQDSEVRARIGSTACSQVTVVAYQEQVRCTVPPASNGAKVVNVSVQGIYVLDPVSYIYDNPVLTSIKPVSVSVHGSEALTLYGQNFGSFDQSPVAYIESKSVEACSSVGWISDSSIVCTIPKIIAGVATNNTALVVIGAAKSNRWDRGSTFTFYDVPLYFECPRKTNSDCFRCVYEKCNIEAIDNYGAAPSIDAARTGWLQPSMCNSIGMQYCNYGRHSSPGSESDEARFTAAASVVHSSDPVTLQANRGSACAGAVMIYEVDDVTRSIHTNACPSISPQSPRHHNAKSQSLAFHLPALPILSKQATPLSAQGIIGVAVDGTPFYSPTDSSGADLVARYRSSLDSCGGRVSASGMYHYLANPVCSYSDPPGRHSPIIGMMLDGIPLYGRHDVGGKLPAKLDACNGHTDRENRFYHYHTTDGFPYLIGCFKGCLRPETLNAVNGALRQQPCQPTAARQTSGGIGCALTESSQGLILDCRPKTKAP